MAGRINVDTTVLRGAADDLEEQHEGLNDINKKIQNNMSQMREIWQDDSNAAREAYVQKMENVTGEIETKLSPGIYSLSNILRALAQNIDNWNNLRD